MAVRDRIRRASLDAVAAENAAVVIDVVDLGVALGGRDARFFGVLGGLNVNAVRRARRRAEKTGDTFFQTIFIALQLVLAAETLLELRATHGPFAVWIVLYLGRLEGLTERDAHAFGDSGGVVNNRHSSSIRRAPRGMLDGMKLTLLAPALLFAFSLSAATQDARLADKMPPEQAAAKPHAKPPVPPSKSLDVTVPGAYGYVIRG